MSLKVSTFYHEYRFPLSFLFSRLGHCTVVAHFSHRHQDMGELASRPELKEARREGLQTVAGFPAQPTPLDAASRVHYSQSPLCL